MLPPTVQTSPYLTLVRPHQPIPIRYMTDTRGPEHPTLTDPGDAAFGVIGLDRQVVWHRDSNALTALEVAAAEPMPTSELVARFGVELIQEVIAAGWLQDPSELCRAYLLRTAQIEVTAHCNWGCRFCPVSRDPKAPATMPMELFAEIVEKLAVISSIRFVTFHFFNEPTLDRYFIDRIELLAQKRMKLSLSTNASGLTPKKIDALKRSGVVHHLIFNLPALEEAEFRALTGARTHSITLRNVRRAIDAGLPIRIAVNGVGPDHARNVERLRDCFEPLGVEVRPTSTCDRAGVVAGAYDQNVGVMGRLNGCSWPLNHAYFSVVGDMFLCCNDYYQREVFGNVGDGTIDEVMSSPAAVGVRRRVFGVEQAPDDFVCRSCHNQNLDFQEREFRPPATFPLRSGGAALPRLGFEPDGR